LDEPTIVGRLQFEVGNGYGDPGSFSLDGSHDGTNWETIMEQRNQRGEMGDIKTYEVTNSNKFRFYRVNIKETMSVVGSSGWRYLILQGLTMNESLY
jgi:hypothetical protein